MIKLKIVLLSMFLVITSVSIVAFGIGRIFEEKYLENEENNLQSLASLTSQSIEYPIISNDYDKIEKQLSHLNGEKNYRRDCNHK